VGEPKNGFLLSALSHLKLIFNAGIVDLKKNLKKKAGAEARKGKSAELMTSLPPWKTVASEEKIPDVSKLKLAEKKINFYLSWVSECYHEYELFYR